MRGKRAQGIAAGMTVFLYIMLMVASSYAAEVVIGSNSADIGTIVFVSPKPLDTAQANGTALLNALAGITPSADGDNPYLIKLGPGTYDLGSAGLKMQQYVSIEGSGEKATKITAVVSSSGSVTTATVMGADNAELRSLTVENTGAGAYKAGVLNPAALPSASAKLINVTATASGGTHNYGVYNDSSSPVMTNVTATASGGAGSDNYGIYNNSSSPAMTNVKATAAGGTLSHGIYNNSSSPVMTNVTATASGGTGNIGVYNDSSSPVMTNVTATASGGTDSIGVYNNSSSPVITNVTTTASGGTNNYGVYSETSGTVKINHSVITGATTIYNADKVITLVGNSQLDGGAVVNYGILTCAGVCDGSYTFYEGKCPP